MLFNKWATTEDFHIPSKHSPESMAFSYSAKCNGFDIVGSSNSPTPQFCMHLEDYEVSVPATIMNLLQKP